MTGSAQPVLSVIVRRFRHEMRDDVERLVGRIGAAVSRQAGFIRVQNDFSSKGGDDELVTVFSFDTRENLERWVASPVRVGLVRELDGLSTDDVTHTRFDALAMLASPTKSIRKIETVLILIFWILVMGRVLGLIADLVLPEWLDRIWRDALIIVINVLLISYILLPWSSTKLAWLKTRLSRFAKSGEG